jgi:hypothetical protein
MGALMDASVYLLQGFFFQNREWLGIAMAPIDGAVAVIRRGLCRDMFAGLIWRENDSDLWGWVGEMTDQFGAATLGNIEINPEELRFTKHYLARPGPIDYAFRRDGDLWVGGFNGEVVGEGGATCVLTPAPGRLLRSA